MSGYPLSLFVTEPEDDLKCLICLGVARDPLQHEECGKMFCKWCIQQYGMDRPCPNCRQTSNFYKDKRSRRAIGILKVKCGNVEGKCEWEGALEALDKHEATCITVCCTNTHGCEWTGTAQQVEKHLATCQFSFLPCPNQCRDSANRPTQILRKDLARHLDNCPLREHQCQFCGEKGTHAHITQAHQQTCPDKPTACPECKETVLQGRKKKHLEEECEMVDIPCKYQALGCRVKVKRHEKAAHEQDDKTHLHLALETIMNMKKPGPTTIKFRLTGYEWKKDEDYTDSPTFYTSPNGYKLKVLVLAHGSGDGEGTHISVGIQVRRGSEYDSELKWRLVGSLTVTLLNQLEDKNHYSKTITLAREDNVDFWHDKWCDQFIPHSELGHDPAKNVQYLKNNTLYFEAKALVNDAPLRPWLANRLPDSETR